MARWALPLAVFIGLIVAWAASRPPAARLADAPVTAFSAGRAMEDVRAIARAPHPVGSPENARVRDHLLARMRTLGLSPQVRPAASDGVRVENILGVLPGADRSAPAVLLMAHYDSVPESPGAADDAAGVAAILEAVRAYQASGGRPARDIMVLLTDGEEAGLLGARAFWASDPASRRVGLVLNFEARGGGGRTMMFETGAGNAELVALYAGAVPSPTADSLSRFVYDRRDDIDVKTDWVCGEPHRDVAQAGKR